MTENLEALPARVDRIERKLDSLTSSVDKRFDDVSEAIAEQRQYTEFAFERLQGMMVDQFQQLSQKLDRAATLDQLEQLSQKLDRAATLDQLEPLSRKLDRILALSHSRRPRARAPKKR